MLRFQVCLQDNPACVKKPPASKFCYSLQLNQSVRHDDQGALEIKSSMGTKSKSFVARVPGPRPGGLFVIEKKFFGQPCSLDVVVRCGLHDNHRSHFLLSLSLTSSFLSFGQWDQICNIVCSILVIFCNEIVPKYHDFCQSRLLSLQNTSKP